MKTAICGAAVSDLPMEELTACAMSAVSCGQGHYIVTPNPKLLSLAAEDPQLRQVLNGALLAPADGIGVLLAARWKGTPIQHRVPGIELGYALAKAAAEGGYSIYLLGGVSGRAEAAAAYLQRQIPGLKIAGCCDGYHLTDQTPMEIRRTGADLVFVCLGCPKQEVWMAEYGRATGAGLLIGLGGSFDVWSGAIRRAPETLRRMGLEWLWRCLLEPKRIKELWRIPYFLLRTLRWNE